MGVFLALAIAFLLSCGSSQDKEKGILLVFKEEVQEEFFSRVSLRVSSERQDPYLLTKEGPFFPGDEVIFEGPFPEEGEVHLEAFVYNPSGEVSYYGWTVADFLSSETVYLEVVHPDLRIEGFVPFLDGEKLVDPPAYTFLGGDLSQEGDTGVYLAHKREEGLLSFTYIYGKDLARLPYVEVYTLKADLPQSESFLRLSGSYEGILVEGTELRIRSDRIFSDGSYLIAGVGEGIYLFSGNVSDGSLTLERFSCISGSDPDCAQIDLSVQGVDPDRVEIHVLVGGLDLLVSSGDRFLKGLGGDYVGRFFGTYSFENCNLFWRVDVPLGEGFDGTAQVEILPVKVSLSDPVSGTIRVYGPGVEVEGFCENAKAVEFPAPAGILKEGTFFEVQEGLSVVGVLIRDLSVSLPKASVDETRFYSDGDHAVFSFSKSGSLEYCSLKLEGFSLKVEVDRIPSFMNYVKLGRVLGLDLPSALGEGPLFDLTCWSGDGSFYVGRRVSPQGIAQAYLFPLSDKTLSHPMGLLSSEKP